MPRIRLSEKKAYEANHREAFSQNEKPGSMYDSQKILAFFLILPRVVQRCGREKLMC